MSTHYGKIETMAKSSLPATDHKKPTVKFVNRFSFAQKFALICLQFILCFGIVLFFMVREQTIQVNTLQLSAEGLRYFHPIANLMKYMSEHQQTGQRYLMGDTSLENVLSYLDQRITENFSSLLEIDEKVGPDLFPDRSSSNDWQQNSANPIKIRQEWEQLRANFNTLTLQASLNQHIEIFTHLRTLTSLVSDGAGLTTGSDLATSYLSYIFLIQVPELQQQLLYVASLAERDSAHSQAPAKPAMTEEKKEPPSKNANQKPSDKPPVAATQPRPDETVSITDKEELASHIVLAEETLEDIATSVWRAVNARKNQYGDLTLKAAIEDPLSQLSSATSDFLSTVKRGFLKVNTPNVLPSTLIVSSNRALNETYQFSEIGSEQFEKITVQLLDAAEYKRRMCLILVTSLAAIALINSVILLKAMLTPLHSLVAAAEQLAKGNLSVRVDVARNDEIAHVGMAMNKMAISIEEVLERLQHAGVELTTSSTEIAAAAKEQETTTVQQETATKQIAVTAKEISATASEFANYIHEVTRSAEQTSTLASTGKDGLSKLKSIMKQMVDATSEIADKLSSLNEKTGVITGVITTITKVADRTNLLSLNAAIEAHKLGAKGGSFGVIATEIRRLADQTAYATLDIEKVVHQMVSAVSDSVEGVAKFSEDISQGVKEANVISGLLTKIIAQVQQQTASFESVNQGMETQSAGAKQITDSIEELSEAAQQSTTSIRQFHLALSHLTIAIKDLQSTVARLQHEETHKGPPPPKAELKQETALASATP